MVEPVLHQQAAKTNSISSVFLRSASASSPGREQSPCATISGHDVPVEEIYRAQAAKNERFFILLQKYWGNIGGRIISWGEMVSTRKRVGPCRLGILIPILSGWSACAKYWNLVSSDLLEIPFFSVRFDSFRIHLLTSCCLQNRLLYSQMFLFTFGSVVLLQRGTSRNSAAVRLSNNGLVPYTTTFHVDALHKESIRYTTNRSCTSLSSQRANISRTKLSKCWKTHVHCMRTQNFRNIVSIRWLCH